MGVSFKEYLSEQKEAFFEKRYSSKEEGKTKTVFLKNNLPPKKIIPQNKLGYGKCLS